MYTLGINAAFHDSAACLVKNGTILAAAEEERFTRIKHGKRPEPFSAYELPFHAIEYCLRTAGVPLRAVQNVAYSFNPFPLIQRAGGRSGMTLPLEPNEVPAADGLLDPWEVLHLIHIVHAPRHLASGAPLHLRKLFDGLGELGPENFHFVDHHVAHAASAFLPSPFDEAAVLTIDGRGERTTTMYAHGSGSALETLGTVSLPHSLGLLYEELTIHLGFLHSSDEYKVMALAAMGEPRMRSTFEQLIDLRDDGSYEIAPHSFTDLFGPPRMRGEPLEPGHLDLACSLQRVLEGTVLEMSKILRRRTGASRLCMAGGVALNCVMNGVIRDQGPFDDVWVQPAAGDAGTALGAALWIDSRKSEGSVRKEMEHVFLGPEFTDQEIEDALKLAKLRYRRPGRLFEEVARLLEHERIIGWFQGRMEFGPRALGGRSILASPRSAEMQDRLNALKDREDFRPVAPVVLEEALAEWFEPATVSPFMLFVHTVRKEKERFIPAVCHKDGTARVQSIRRGQNAAYYDLIRAFAERTGVPILVNTSFNSRGQPIVCTPRDAIECFFSSPLDALVLGSFLLEKQ